MMFSIATPAFNGLPWLRACVASVRDQGEEGSWVVRDWKSEVRKDHESESEKGNEKTADFQHPSALSCPPRIPELLPPVESPSHPRPSAPGPRPSSLAVEHLIQDACSDGIEDFAHEVGAEFHCEGTLDSRLSPTHPRTSPSARISASGPYRLAICREPDHGMYDAINRAWARSSGEILSYLNCDEQYLPGTLKRVADEFRNHPETDIVFGDAVVINAQGEPLAYRRIVRPSATHTRIVHLGTMSCSMFFRRKLFEDGLRFNTTWRTIGDAEWVCRALEKQPNIRMIHEPLAAFTLTGNNLGANAKALAEATAWRASAPKIHRTLEPVWKALHSARKLLAGAYFPRNLETELYHPEGSKERIAIRKKNLSFHWPAANE